MGLFLNPTDFFFLNFPFSPHIKKKNEKTAKNLTAEKRMKEKHNKHAAPYRKESPVPASPVAWLGMTAE